MHLLIPYIQIRNHQDPNLTEFTYGDDRARARKLKKGLRNRDYVFFHTTICGRKCVTAYFVVDRVLDTVEACKDRLIYAKYNNPHLSECREGKRPAAGGDDVVLFGDPITSRKLDRPLAFDKALATKLSLAIRFPVGRRDSQVIGSATRSWRTLTEKDVEVLLDAIESGGRITRSDVPRTTEEVAETLEKDVEDYLASNPHLIAKDLKLVARQLPTESGRIDLLFQTPQGNLVVVEVKFGRVGREAMRQVQDYMHDLRATEHSKRVTGVLVCSGVMPAFEEELRKQTKVRILVYGWRIQVQPWRIDSQSSPDDIIP